LLWLTLFSRIMSFFLCDYVRPSHAANTHRDAVHALPRPPAAARARKTLFPSGPARLRIASWFVYMSMGRTTIRQRFPGRTARYHSWCLPRTPRRLRDGVSGGPGLIGLRGRGGASTLAFRGGRGAAAAAVPRKLVAGGRLVLGTVAAGCEYRPRLRPFPSVGQCSKPSAMHARTGARCQSRAVVVFCAFRGPPAWKAGGWAMRRWPPRNKPVASRAHRGGSPSDAFSEITTLRTWRHIAVSGAKYWFSSSITALLLCFPLQQRFPRC
jgi:hypothetical protein